MGGGRDNSGAVIYKRINGKYYRIAPYKRNNKKFRNKVNNAKSKNELLKILREKYGENNVPKNFVYKNNISMIRRAINTLTELEDRYPLMKGFVRALGNTTLGAAAMEFEGTFRLNPSFWGHEDDYRLYSEDNDSTDYQNRTPESVVAHEFQHGMQSKLLQMMYPDDFENGDIKSTSKIQDFLQEQWDYGNYLLPIQERAMKRLGISDPTIMYGRISLYAVTNDIFEGLAEAYGDVYANKNNAKKESKVLIEEFMKEFNRYGGKK